MNVQRNNSLNDLPGDWRYDRMGNVAEIFFSNVDKHTFDSEIPVRLCNYVDVYKNDRITSAIEFMEASAEPREIARFQIQKDDVLATKDSETPDDIAIPSLVAEHIPGVLCGYHLALIRPRPHQVHGPYLAWLHSSKAFRSHYEAQAVGVTRFGLSQAAFKEARLPLPPLPEQQRIAAYLDASCAAIDAAVAAKRRQLETLDAYRKSLIHECVTGQRRISEADLAGSPQAEVTRSQLSKNTGQLKLEPSESSGQLKKGGGDDPQCYPKARRICHERTQQ